MLTVDRLHRTSKEIAMRILIIPMIASWLAVLAAGCQSNESPMDGDPATRAVQPSPTEQALENQRRLKQGALYRRAPTAAPK
jgi:hypothetical protein